LKIYIYFSKIGSTNENIISVPLIIVINSKNLYMGSSDAV